MSAAFAATVPTDAAIRESYKVSNQVTYYEGVYEYLLQYYPQYLNWYVHIHLDSYCAHDGYGISSAGIRSCIDAGMGRSISSMSIAQDGCAQMWGPPAPTTGAGATALLIFSDIPSTSTGTCTIPKYPTGTENIYGKYPNFGGTAKLLWIDCDTYSGYNRTIPPEKVRITDVIWNYSGFCTTTPVNCSDGEHLAYNNVTYEPYCKDCPTIGGFLPHSTSPRYEISDCFLSGTDTDETGTYGFTAGQCNYTPDRVPDPIPGDGEPIPWDPDDPIGPIKG